MITERGRQAWQKATDYGKRSLVETTMGRYKALIGPQLRARGFSAQQTEAAIGVVVLNQKLAAGRPDSVRRMRVIAWRSGVGVISFSVLHVHQRPAGPAPITERGRPGWQKATDYGKRSLVETTMGRYRSGQPSDNSLLHHAGAPQSVFQRALVGKHEAGRRLPREPRTQTGQASEGGAKRNSAPQKVA
jgi:hypothetical protein